LQLDISIRQFQEKAHTAKANTAAIKKCWRTSARFGHQIAPRPQIIGAAWQYSRPPSHAYLMRQTSQAISAMSQPLISSRDRADCQKRRAPRRLPADATPRFRARRFGAFYFGPLPTTPPRCFISRDESAWALLRSAHHSAAHDSDRLPPTGASACIESLSPPPAIRRAISRLMVITAAEYRRQAASTSPRTIIYSRSPLRFDSFSFTPLYTGSPRQTGGSPRLISGASIDARHMTCTNSHDAARRYRRAPCYTSLF
jgi:hypothetical protein